MNTYQVVQAATPLTPELPCYPAAVYWIAEQFKLSVEQRRTVKKTGKLEPDISIQRIKHVAAQAASQ